MKNFCIYFFLYVNFVATVVAYYRKCNASFSLCLITNNTEDRSYRNNKFRLNRPSAEIWCRDHSSMLAIITNATVQSAIEAFINDSAAKLMNSYVLTNGYRLNLSTWEWINGIQSVYYVEAIVPAVHHSTHRYAYLVVSTNRVTLFDSHAIYKRKFLCSYITQSSSCSHGFRQLGGRCYKIHNRTANWFNARNICLGDRSDLATFENGIPWFPSEWTVEQFWIGMRKEAWYWWNGQEIKYSNWGGWSPSSSGGDCLCVQTWTDVAGEWTTCNCSQSYRFVCIQDYALHSTSTVKISTVQMTTTTTKMRITQSTATFTLTLGDSSSIFRSTTIHTRNVSDDPQKTLGSEQTSDIQRLIIWIPLAVLIVLIAVFTVVASRIAIVKLRKRSTRQEVSYTANTFQPTSSVDDYTTLKRECLTGNETYAELDVYEIIGDEDQKNSN